MKKIIFSLLLLLAMLAGSCKKDNPVPTLLVLEQKLLGKWTLVSAEVSHIPADPVDYTFDYPAGNYYEFKADGTIKAFVGNSLYDEVWVEVNDNSFFIKLNGPDYPYKIIVATPNQLVIQSEVIYNGMVEIATITLSKP